MRGIHASHSGSGGDMRICDEQPLCQSINYTTVIHIELILSMRCENESTQNAIQCDIDEVLNAVLADITEMSSLVIPCTMVKDGGMDCRAMISVLDNSTLTVSHTLTRQLFDHLANNRTLMMMVSIATTQLHGLCELSNTIMSFSFYSILT